MNFEGYYNMGLSAHALGRCWAEDIRSGAVCETHYYNHMSIIIDSVVVVINGNVLFQIKDFRNERTSELMRLLLKATICVCVI